MRRILRKLLSMMICLVMLASCTALAESGSEVRTPESILAAMSTEQKIAQMLVPDFYRYTDADGNKQSVTEVRPEMEALLKKYGFGGIMIGFPNCGDNAKAARFTADIERLIAGGETGARPFFGIDQEGGYVTRLARGTQMPGNMALGAIGDTEATEQAAELIGSEIRAIGVTANFGPVLDVNNAPANPVINVRSFGDDPEAVAQQGVAYMKGLHKAGALACLKHFPGHGDTDTDSHTGLPCVDKTLEELEACELYPFQACIDAGADMIMTAHIQYPKVDDTTYPSIKTGEPIVLPATLSRVFMTEILREKMGFDGLLLTDALDMAGVKEHFDAMDTAKLAIEAGVDLLLRPVDTTAADGIEQLDQYVQSLARLTDEGKINKACVDAAVLRILKFKEARGLLNMAEAQLADPEKAAATVGSKEHHETEWELASRALTLLKNDGGLPVKAEESAVLVPYDSQVAGARYAVDRMKEEGKLPRETDVPVLCFKSEAMSNVIKTVQEKKTILLVSAAYSLNEMNPSLKDGADSALTDLIIQIAHAAGGKVVLISSHLPYDAARYQDADAILLTYGARGMTESPLEAQDSVAQYGPGIPAAIYQVLTGGVFTGKLPVNLPAMDEGYQYTQQILYTRGSGLER